MLPRNSARAAGRGLTQLLICAMVATAGGGCRSASEPVRKPPGTVLPGSVDLAIECLVGDMSAADAPDEIVALMSWGRWGSDGHRVVRRYGDRVFLEHHSLDEQGDPALMSEVSEPEALEGLLQSIVVLDGANNEIDVVYDGLEFWLVRLTESEKRVDFLGAPGASRVVARIKETPPSASLERCAAVVEEFTKLMPRSR